MSEDAAYHEEEDTSAGRDDYTTCDLADCKHLQMPVPISASHCRKGVYAILKDNPCKIADLAVSKTGKHGSTKANMYGYDVITGKKYQETVPGSATMQEYTPIKIEYEVAAISGNEITGIPITGDDVSEHKFRLPAGEVGEKLSAEFKENAAKNGDKFFVITVLYAPRSVSKKWLANMLVESYKLGKE